MASGLNSPVAYFHTSFYSSSATIIFLSSVKLSPFGSSFSLSSFSYFFNYSCLVFFINSSFSSHNLDVIYLVSTISHFDLFHAQEPFGLVHTLLEHHQPHPPQRKKYLCSSLFISGFTIWVNVIMFAWNINVFMLISSTTIIHSHQVLFQNSLDPSSHLSWHRSLPSLA